jgi:ferrous iron transport protein A
MILSDLKLGERAQIASVTEYGKGDLVSRRLRNLGFVTGEEVVCVAKGPFGGDPLLFCPSKGRGGSCRDRNAIGPKLCV